MYFLAELINRRLSLNILIDVMHWCSSRIVSDVKFIRVPFTRTVPVNRFVDPI